MPQVSGYTRADGTKVKMHSRGKATGSSHKMSAAKLKSTKKAKVRFMKTSQGKKAAKKASM